MNYEPMEQAGFPIRLPKPIASPKYCLILNLGGIHLELYQPSYRDRKVTTTPMTNFLHFLAMKFDKYSYHLANLTSRPRFRAPSRCTTHQHSSYPKRTFLQALISALFCTLLFNFSFIPSTS